MYYRIDIFGQVYGGGTYNSSTYQSGTSTSGGGTTGSGSAGGSVLTNTGFDIVLAATLASVIIFSAVVIRFWKRPAKSAGKD